MGVGVATLHIPLAIVVYPRLEVLFLELVVGRYLARVSYSRAIMELLENYKV